MEMLPSRCSWIVTVHPASVDGIPPGGLLPAKGARIQGPTYEEWLAGDDAAAMAV